MLKHYTELSRVFSLVICIIFWQYFFFSFNTMIMKQKQLVDRHVRAIYRLAKYFSHGFVSANSIN